jgi:alkylation response protein AidB-like acyl-CoA dehydrogenase
VHALLDHGTSAQQRELLPAFAGERFYPAALALLEPRPLFNPHALLTRASSCDGDYCISGEKAMVPLASEAELFIVCADVGDDVQAFLVERGAPGLSIEPEPTMGLRAAQLGRLRLDQVRVPGSSRLGGDAENAGAGPEPRASEVLLARGPARFDSSLARGETARFDAERVIDLARIAWGAMAVGTCSAILEYVQAYCGQRVAFGEPIVHRQSIAFAIANMAVEIDAMRLLVYRAASRAEQDKDFRREAALARVQCADKAMQIASEGVQLLGGHGFIKEHPVELWYRQLRAIAIVEGMLSV